MPPRHARVAYRALSYACVVAGACFGKVYGQCDGAGWRGRHVLHARLQVHKTGGE
jgi:hypothetical protein